MCSAQQQHRHMVCTTAAPCMIFMTAAPCMVCDSSTVHARLQCQGPTAHLQHAVSAL